MSLLNKSINSPAMIAHCFKVISKVVKELNLQQQPVITADQPIYAIAKQVQWLLLDQCKDVVVMIGSFHIEIALLNTMDDWLDESG